MPDQPISPIPPQPSVPPALLVAGVVAAFVLCIVAFLAGMQWNRSVAMNGNGGYPVTGDTDVPPGEEEVSGEVEYNGEPPVEIPTEDSTLPEVEKTLSVSWYPQARQSEVTVSQSLVDAMGEEVSGSSLPIAFALGEVTNDADLGGYRLELHGIPIIGMGESYRYSYLLRDPDGKRPDILLARYSAWLGFGTIAYHADPTLTDAFTEAGGVINLTYAVEALETPSRTNATIAGVSFIKIGEGEYFQYPAPSGRPYYPVDLYPIVATLQDGTPVREWNFATDTALRGVSGGFFTFREDGRIVWYDLVLPYWPVVMHGEEWDLSDLVTSVPTFTINGKQNQQIYSKGSFSGCGMGGASSVIAKADLPELKEVGSAGNVKVYAPTRLDEGRYLDMYTAWKTRFDDREGKTIEDFRALVPYLYVQDPLERWIELTNVEVVPAAECGKPVIYLYPEETTDISVKLFPQGGFTKTEPAYGNGWNVTASPDGTLVNKADGLTYPYLFWEGRGGLYAEPTRYWVVKRENVRVFLVDTLAKLGLNEKETADFLEFWEPRMQAAPYYKIGFHGTNVMDQIAPLKLSERPDTILRVLMDYQELSAPIAENPPRLPATPVRNGFTLIEWGGVIR